MSGSYSMQRDNRLYDELVACGKMSCARGLKIWLKSPFCRVATRVLRDGKGAARALFSSVFTGGLAGQHIHQHHRGKSWFLPRNERYHCQLFAPGSSTNELV